MKDWVRRIIRYIRVFIHFKRINFLERLAFRSGFLLLATGVLLNIILNILFIKIIYSWVTSINGWSYFEALIVVGTAILIERIVWMTCAYLHALKLLLKRGDLDGYLTKPMDSQFLVSCFRGDLEDIVGVVLGTGLIAYGVCNLNIPILDLMRNLAFYLIMIINAYVIIYSISVIVNSISFWTIESPSTFAVFEAVTRASQYPADIYSKIVKAMFMSFIPIAFISTVPARMLTGKFNLWHVLGSFSTAAIFLLIARYVWKKGLGTYSSASS